MGAPGGLACRLGVLLVFALLSCLGAGCAEDGSCACGPGQDGVPSVPSKEDFATFRFGDLAVSELEQHAGSDPGHSTQVQAHFADFYNFRVQDAAQLDFSEACHVSTGQPVRLSFCWPTGSCLQGGTCPEGTWCHLDGCAPVQAFCDPAANPDPCPGELVCSPLHGLCMFPACPAVGDCPSGYSCKDGKALALVAGAVAFEGLAGGNLVLDPDLDDRLYPVELLPGRAYQAGTIKASVAMAQATGPMVFPEASIEVDSPRMPVLTRLDGEANPDPLAVRFLRLAERFQPLQIEWEPAGGDYMELILKPGNQTQTPSQKLRCITHDDGGLEIPLDALRYLALDAATDFQLIVERHQRGAVLLGEGFEAGAGALLLDLSAATETTVGR